MTKVAVLGPNIRLLVIQFHMKTSQVPSVVPAYSEFHKSIKNQIDGKNGTRVMEPTPNVMLSLFADTKYQLIDVWHEFDEENWKNRKVRYVFCNPVHVESARLHPDFIAQRETLLDSLKALVGKNLWQTMSHLNPFFLDQLPTDQDVLMFDSNSRKATVVNEKPVTVFAGGRDKLTNEGIGPKVLLTNKANRLKLFGNEVVLTPPETIIEQV